MTDKEIKKLIRKWKQIHLKRLKLALYQYSMGIITGGAVAEELRLLKMLDEIDERAVREGGFSILEVLLCQIVCGLPASIPGVLTSLSRERDTAKNISAK